MLQEGNWARDWDCCQECGAVERPHHAKGLCDRCYERKRYYKGDNHCVDCGAEIGSGATCCPSCAAEVRCQDEEYCRKLSKATKAAWERGDFDGISEAIKAAWERGDYDGHSEAMKAAWERGDMDGHSEAMKAAWQRGDFGDEKRCRKISEAMKARWEHGAYDGVFQSPTSIELQVAAALDIVGIEHQSQYRPDGYGRVYDEFVPPNTLIEIQGDYWHSLLGRQTRDAEKAQWAKEHGFEFIEIWEHEIKAQGAWSIVAQLGLK